MDSKTSILIVDRSAESREVLRTALRRPGVEILEASRPEQGLALVKQHHPRVIVLDLEATTEADEGICGRFAAEAPRGRSSLVVLGNARIDLGRTLPPDGDSQFVAKPYHYGPLIRKIEELLA